MTDAKVVRSAPGIVPGYAWIMGKHFMVRRELSQSRSGQRRVPRNNLLPDDGSETVE